MAVRSHARRRALGHDRAGRARASRPGPRDGRPQRLSRDAVEQPVPDRAATRSTGCTPAIGSSRTRSSCTRAAARRHGAGIRPTTSSVARRGATANAILYLLELASCPYAGLSTRAEASYCGPLFDDLEIDRGWRRDPLGSDTAGQGRWGRVRARAGAAPARDRDLRTRRPDDRAGGCRRRQHHDPLTTLPASRRRSGPPAPALLGRTRDRSRRR